MHLVCYLNKLLLLLLSLLPFGADAQCPNPVADGMICYFRYDDDNATSSGGGLTFNDVWGYVDQQGNEFAILGGYDSIYMFDISNPAISKKTAVDDAPGTSLWRDFKVYGHYMYAVADQGSTGLRVYDLDSLAVGKLHLVGAYTNDFLRAHNIFIDVDQAKLYVVGSNSGAVREGLLIYDLSSDAKSRNPSLINAFQLDTLINQPGLNFYIHDIFVRNDTAYCSHGYQGYYIWDLTDPINPDSSDLIGFLDNAVATGGSYVHSSWNSDDNNYAYMATEVSSNYNNKRIYIIDQSDKTQPFVVNTWKEPLLETGCFQDNNVPHNPFVKDGKLYISYYEDGVQVLDLNDPADPVSLAYYDTESANTTYHGTTANWGVFPFFPSGSIIASDTKNGLFVMQLGTCPVATTMQNEVVIEDMTILASASISLEDVDVDGSHLIIIAPDVLLDQNCEFLSNAQLTVINEDRCGH